MNTLTELMSLVNIKKPLSEFTKSLTSIIHLAGIAILTEKLCNMSVTAYLKNVNIISLAAISTSCVNPVSYTHLDVYKRQL